jgi:tetratricopeptide (TPR) repeat protein
MAEEHNLEPEPKEPLPEATEDGLDEDEGAKDLSATVPALTKGMTSGQRLAAKRAAKAAAKREFKDELKEQRAEEQRKAQEAQQLSSRTQMEPALPEEVEVVARGFTEFAHEQRNKILGVIGAFFVISAAVILVRGMLTSSSSEAAGALTLALEIASANVDPEDKDGKTDLGDPVFASRTERTKKSAEAFASVAKRFADKPVALWAKVAEGAAHMELNAPDKALAQFDEAARTADSQVEVKARAVEGAAIALEAQDKLAEALKRYEELKTINGDATKNLAEYHIARLKLKQGDREGGKALLKQLYDRLSSQPEGTPPSRFLRGEVEVRLSEIDSSLVDKGTTGTGESFSQEQLQRLIEQLRNQQGGAPGVPGAP